ncbi:uncharacterized protein zgc:174895 [Oncorhynchus keta]|uniref:uncharacterized protein zgc:174895 n=1 Tax=Oncorhynchus keta TaxID=8018 RepID=UPI0015FA83A5|nr:uncharacterized protein zgc:174895 [Oncorhynchus keta]
MLNLVTFVIGGRRGGPMGSVDRHNPWKGLSGYPQSRTRAYKSRAKSTGTTQAERRLWRFTWLQMLIVDQWIETGGTMKAAIKLVERQGVTVVGHMPDNVSLC